MSKVFKIFRTKLTWYMIGCVILSGLLAFCCGFLIVRFGLDFVETYFDDEETNRTFQLKYMENLQTFVDEEDITGATISKVSEWTDENTYVYLSIYQNNKLIFNSDYAYIDAEALEDDDITESAVLLDEVFLYKLHLADGTVASVDMFCYDYWQYYYYVWTIGVVVGIVLFVVGMTRFLQRKMRYIHNIERELHILEGGNLEYPITIVGEDELSGLAKGIEQMRLSIIENMRKEQKMQQANQELVTSMSHDLRTPLTTLTGYLEILNMDQEKTEEQKKHYLELSLAKSREIKALSDDLFEYFLIYGEDAHHLEMETIPVFSLASDLIENQFLGLEEEGYQLRTTSSVDENSGSCLMNPQYMQRILNNILSNLWKYADKNQPIEINIDQRDNQLMIEVKNTIKENFDLHESTKIGLITCSRIMKLHHGKFEKIEEDGTFKVRLSIPMENKEKGEERC